MQSQTSANTTMVFVTQVILLHTADGKNMEIGSWYNRHVDL
jgi:hypothetical protein